MKVDFEYAFFGTPQQNRSLNPMKRKRKSESPYLDEMQDKIRSISETRDDSEKLTFFMQFTIQFEEFLNRSGRQQLVNKNAPNLTNQMMSFAHVGLHSIPCLISLLRILSKSNEISPVVINPNESVPLFISIFQSSNSFSDTVEKCLNVVEYFFKHEQFFSLFIKSNGVNVLFQTAFFHQLSTAHFAELINKLLFQSVPFTYFQNFPFQQFFIDTLKIDIDLITDSLLSEFLFFLSNLFWRMSHFVKNATKFFIGNGFLSFYDNLVEKSTRNHSIFYKTFINSLNNDFSNPPNCEFIKDLFQKYKSTFSTDFFDLILEYIVTDSNQAQKINQATPFVDYFLLNNSPVSHLIPLFTGINSVLPDSIRLCIPPLFAKLFTHEASTVNYQVLADILEEKICLDKITYRFLLESGFITVFFTDIPKESLFALLTENEQFKSMAIQIYQIPEATSYQSMVFKSILNIFDLFANKNEFIKILDQYFALAPNPANVSLLLEKITETQSPELFDYLLDTFLILKESAESFIKVKGLDKIYKFYNDNLITIEKVAIILSKLVVFKGFPEIDEFIMNLPKNHPLFDLDKEYMMKIVYGESPQFPLIRSTSAIPFILPIDHLDPYNAWILSTRFVDQYKDDIFKTPMLTAIFNRNVKQEFLPQLMKSPETFTDFVNLQYDQFPLFQFFPSNENSSFVINQNFFGISFWFKYSENITNQATLFKTNNVIITINSPSTLSINCDNMIETVAINEIEWNHVFISIQSSIMQHTLKVYFNNKTIQFVSKIPSFGFASFNHSSNGILFLGSTIRLFKSLTIKQDPINFHGLYYKGAGFMRGFISSGENIITPKTLTLEKANLTVPSNLFYVPYFGFALYFSSTKKLNKLLSIIQETDDLNLYESLFDVVLRIFTVDNTNKNFFGQMISLMKRTSKFLTEKLFVKFLTTVKATQKDIPLIIYDKDLWKSINNEIIIEALFEYFSNRVDWQLFENIELFFSKIVFENSSSRTIFLTLLSNHQKLPKLLKYIVSILKVAPTLSQMNCSWDSVEFREETPIQHTILDCLYQFISSSTIELIETLLPFDDLESLMMVSPRSIASKTFHLIAIIAGYDPNYIPMNDTLFLYIVASLSSDVQVWNDILEMKTVNYPLHMILIWCGAICMVHQKTYCIAPSSHLENIETLLNKAIEICSSELSISAILNNESCQSLIMTWFPFILHYYILYQAFPDKENLNTKPYDQITLAQIPEAVDSIWIGSEQVFNEVGFQIPLPPAKSSQFMLERVSSILTSNGFQVPFPPLNSTAYVSEWLTTSPLLPFITDLILNSPSNNLNKLLFSFFFEFVVGNTQHSDPLTPIFVHSIINRLADIYISFTSTYPSTSTIQILQFLHVLTGLQSLQDSSLIIISDLLMLAKFIQTKQGPSALSKFTCHFEPIILSLFSSLSSSSYQDVFQLFTNHIQMFCTLIIAEKSILTWLYVFFIASHHEKRQLNLFLQKLMPLLKLDKNHSQLFNKLVNKSLERDMEAMSHLEEAWKKKSNDFQAKFQQYYKNLKETKSTFVTDIGNLSFECSQFRFKSNAKHFLISRLLSQTMKYLTTSFLLKQEHRHWKQFTFSLINDPKPTKCEHLSPFFFPLSIPRIMTPSPYPMIDLANDNTIRSVPIKLFKQNISYSYQITPDIKPNAVKLFTDLYSYLGQPLSISNCSICRYTLVIPSVLALFNDCIKLICDCQLSSNSQDEFDYQSSIKTPAMHFFLESVLIGHWGVTEMFASKIVITIKFNDLINIRKLKDTTLLVYSFSAGNFLLNLQRRDVLSKLLKLKDTILLQYDFQSSVYAMTKNKSKNPVDLFIGSSFPNFNWESILNKNDILSKFKKGELSAIDTLLRINALNNRSFLTLDSLPSAPKLQPFEPPPLTALLPFKYFSKTIKNDDTSEPLSIMGCLDFYNEKTIRTYFKLRQEFESDASKEVISNFIMETFQMNFASNEPKVDSDDKKNIGFVVSELNSNKRQSLQIRFSSGPIPRTMSFNTRPENDFASTPMHFQRRSISGVSLPKHTKSPIDSPRNLLADSSHLMKSHNSIEDLQSLDRLPSPIATHSMDESLEIPSISSTNVLLNDKEKLSNQSTPLSFVEDGSSIIIPSSQSLIPMTELDLTSNSSHILLKQAKSTSSLSRKSILFTPKKSHKMSGLDKIAQFYKCDHILPLHQLSLVLLDLYIITIESIEMKITSRDGKTIFAKCVNPHFEYANNISISSNGLFVVIDSHLSISETYQIFYRNGKPSSFEHRSLISFEHNVPKSVISGDTFTVLTEINNEIVVWNVFKDFIFRTINPNIIADFFRNSVFAQSESNDCVLETFSYDEVFDIVWFAATDGIYATSSSGIAFAYHSKEEKAKITCMKAVNLPNYHTDRVALIGDENGRVYFAYIVFDEKKINIIELAKLHNSQIVEFEVNKFFTVFLSVDLDGNIFTWKI